jgi:outer membrane receptor protein involved in Fe transport
MPIVPHHRGSAGALAHLPYEVELGTNLNWVGSRFVINDIANEFNTLSAHSTWDAHVAWRPWIGKHLRLHVMGLVYNLLDRTYSDVAGLRFNFDPTVPPFGDFVGQRRFFPSEERSWEARVAIEIQR